MANISNATWQRLFDAADRFRKLAPWNWMKEIDLFAVQNPHSKEMGYCCVLGSAGEHFALNVYRGTRGLDGLFMLWQEDEVDPMDLLTFQDCLVAGFENRDLLDKEDLQLIKSTERHYRGKHVWPIFRDYSPGYFPWFLDSEDDILFLTYALEQGADICQKYQDKREIFTSKDYKEFIARIPYETDQGLEWKEEWIPLPEEAEEENTLPPILYNQIKVQQLSQQVEQGKQVWQVGFFIVTEAVQDREQRPFFPHVFLFVDESSELIIHFLMSHPARFKQDFLPALLEAIEKTATRPREIRFTEDLLIGMAQPVLDELSISYSVLEEDHALVDQIFAGMMQASRDQIKE